MPLYRIHRIKETPRENFRWAPHTGGLATVKPKDYSCNEDVRGDNPYDIWKIFSIRGNPLCPGDLLELENESPDGTLAPGSMWIAKYIGFEPAQWYVPEPSPHQAIDGHEAAALNAVPEPEGCPS